MAANQGTVNPQGNQLTFLGEDQSGFKISPQKVLFLCLFYIGSVVFFHIFAKVKVAGVQPTVIPETPPPAGDL